MKFEFDKRSGAVIAVIALAFFGLGLAINTQRDIDTPGHMGMHSSAESNSTFSGEDIMFAQMMIPHHQQAIEMSDIALDISEDSEVIALAKVIKGAQAPEISQMTSWLETAGQGLMGTHSMSMNGMLSEREIEELRSSSGKTFDKLFLAGMIAHHEGALEMVEMIENSDNPEAKKLASDIKISQSAEIVRMKKYLAQIK